MSFYRIKYRNINNKEFEISTDGVWRPSGLSLNYSLSFGIVELSTNKKFSFTINIPHIQVVGKWGFSGDISFNSSEGEKIKKFLLREGFKKIQKKLDEEDLQDQNFILSPEEIPDSPESIPKLCFHLIWDSAGSIRCRILNDYTTYPKCEECDFPEYFGLCDHLKNPRPQKVSADQEDWYVIYADCNKSGKEIKGSELKKCIDKDCFEPITISSPQKPTPIVGNLIIREIREKIDNVNLFINKKYGFNLFSIVEQKIWNILDTPCNNEDSFNSHILALKNIFDWINKKELREKIKSKIDKEEGNIKHLQKFLEEQYPQSSKTIERIKNTFTNINKISQKFPRHKTPEEVIDALKFFSIQYPIKNWEEAWNKIIKEFYSSLILLEELLR